MIDLVISLKVSMKTTYKSLLINGNIIVISRCVGLLIDVGISFWLLQSKYRKNKYFHIQNVYEFLLLSKKQDIYLSNPLQFLNRASLTVSTHFE